jgi:hypothetical protein
MADPPAEGHAEPPCPCRRRAADATRAPTDSVRPAPERAGLYQNHSYKWRAFFQRIGQIAEAEDHHPDLHLTGYRNVAIELSTHALGGLSENDFILAAKIDQLPVALKK